MRPTLTAIIGAVLAGVLLAGPLAPAAFTAKSGSVRYYQGHHGKVSAAPYRFLRCKGGRTYAYGAGWGCDYYVYSYDYPKGRRR